MVVACYGSTSSVGAVSWDSASSKIKELLKFIDEPNHYCGEVKAMAILQARAVQQKIDDLERLKGVKHDGESMQRSRYSIDDCPILMNGV